MEFFKTIYEKEQDVRIQIRNFHCDISLGNESFGTGTVRKSLSHS
jgi:hypothetical protein